MLLTLFIAGHTLQSERTIGSLQKLCSEILHNDYFLEIVNVLEAPQVAETRNILATPTLIRESPEPQRRIIGDLSDTNKVVAALEMGLFISQGGSE